jgi:hypothetical protein
VGDGFHICADCNAGMGKTGNEGTRERGQRCGG